MKGILFKPDMIKAIIEGKKTVTRRFNGLKEINKEPEGWRCELYQGDWQVDKGRQFVVVKPRYQIGEVVYIKEAWRPYSEKEVRIEYKLDGALIDYPNKPNFMFYACGQAWRSPLFLPAEFARYFIRFKDVKPERLQEITKEDIKAEGFSMPSFPNSRLPYFEFKDYWDSINPKQKWETNSWVWRYEFEYLPDYKEKK